MKSFILFILVLVPIFSWSQIENESCPESQAVLETWQEYFEEHLGQDKWQKGSGYKPYLRHKRLVERNFVNSETSHSSRRWESYTAIKENILHSREDVPSAQWRSIGPSELDGQGGRMQCVKIDHQNPEVIWAGSASGGLWKSIDSGESWKAMTDQIPSSGVGAIAINPDSSNVILIGTGEGYLAGQQYFPSIRGGIGVFRSEDDGLTWEQANFEYPRSIEVSVLEMAWDPIQKNKVWLGATNGLFLSNDYGKNWEPILYDGSNHGSFIVDDLLIHPSDSNVLYVALEGQGILKSIDGGENFDVLSGGLPFSDMNFISIDLCRDHPEVLYANITSGPNSGFGLRGIYKSINGGDTWVHLESAPAVQCSPQFQNVCQGWYNNCIAVSPVDPDELLIGGVTVYISKDGGLSWDQKDRLICLNCVDAPECTFYVDNHDIYYNQTDPSIIFTANDGGIARTTDGGACWEEVNSGLNTSQFYAVASSRVNPNVITGGFQDHGLQGVDLDFGAAWDKWGFFDGADVAHDPVSAKTLYGTWIDGTYWKTTNQFNGLASPINSGINQNENTAAHFAPIQVHPTDPNILLGSTMQKIYLSQSGGAGWSATQTVSIVTELAFSQAKPSICYAAAWQGNSWSFWRSEDTGLTWQQTANSPGWRVTDLKTSYIDESTVFASRNSINPNNPHVFKSVDKGETWVPIQGDLPDLLCHSIEVNAFNDDILYAATDLGIFITTNGGINWTEYNDGMPICYSLDLDFNPTDTSLIVGTHGRGAWRTKAYTELVVTSITESLMSDLDVELYPIPSIGEFTIDIKSDLSEQAELTLYNSNGQFLETISTNIGTGRSQFQIDKDKYKRKLFFLKIRVGKMAKIDTLLIY